MQIDGSSVLVTGAGSGLGLAAARKLASSGARVTLLDQATSRGGEVAQELSSTFVPADVTDEQQVRAAIEAASSNGPLRALVHCAGGPGRSGVLDEHGKAAPLGEFARVVSLNLVGTYSVLRLAAETMAATEPVDGERGVCVLTSSTAAFEGLTRQVSYAASEAGIVGLALASARDLAGCLIRVCTIAAPCFDTWLPSSIFERFTGSIPHPNRMGNPDEFALLAASIIENPMFNGETIRLDAASRPPRR